MSTATKSQPLTRAELDALVAAGHLHEPLAIGARALGMGESSCRAAALAGQLPVRTFMVGRTIRFVLADLVDLFTSPGEEGPNALPGASGTRPPYQGTDPAQGATLDHDRQSERPTGGPVSLRAV